MDQILTGRSDFVWGVTGHNGGYPAYPAERLEEQIKLAAALGVTSYRLNYTPQTADSFAYLDRAVALCEEHGLGLFLVVFDSNFLTCYYPDLLFAAAQRIAARYRGRIALYQVSNEKDIASLDLITYKDPVGDLPEHYDRHKYTVNRDCMRAIADGLRAGDPEARTCINISWRHTGILDMLNADGVQWDVNGLDWYYGLDDHGQNNIVRTLNHLCALPQQEVIIAEANSWGWDYTFTEQEQADYLCEAMAYYYHYPNRKVKGFYVYELLDEPNHDKVEGHFGLVLNDPHGNIGRRKLAFDAVAALLKQEGQG